MEIKPVTKETDYFFNCLQENYTTKDSLFQPSFWADMSFTLPRTKNSCEAFHSTFNAEFNASKPNIYAFIDTSKYVPPVTYIKLRSHQEKTPEGNFEAGGLLECNKRIQNRLRYFEILKSCRLQILTKS